MIKVMCLSLILLLALDVEHLVNVICEALLICSEINV